MTTPGERDHQVALRQALTALHLAAGEPSTRVIARTSGQLSHDTVHRVLAGQRLPAWAPLERVVLALGGDVAEFHRLWLAARTGRPAEPVAEVAADADAGPAARPDAAPGSIRVLVVDDHTLFRRAMATVLEQEAGIEVVGEAGDGPAARDLALASRPDVVLMDIRMPGMDGIEATRQIVAADPAARVVILTMSDDEADVADAFAAGAVDYVVKSVTLPELTAAIRAAATAATPSTRARRPVASRPESADLPSLTAREWAVLGLVVQGSTNREIAEQLQLSEKTVSVHLSHIYRKLGVTNRTALATAAAERGWTRNLRR